MIAFHAEMRSFSAFLLTCCLQNVSNLPENVSNGVLGFKKTGGFFGFLEKPVGFDALIAIFTVSLSPARAHARVRYVYSIRNVYTRMPVVIFYSKTNHKREAPGVERTRTSVRCERLGKNGGW